MASSLLVLILLQIVFAYCEGLNISNSKFSAILIFGDSLLDTGNNNFLPTPFKANHRPYGQSFPGGLATGRFSNGKLMSDMIASAIGVKDTVPPFLDQTLSDDDIRTGVCFASAGSGYDDVTTLASRVIPVSRQPLFLATYIRRLKGIVGEEQAANIIKDSLVFVTSGSNDFAISFYDSATRSRRFTVSMYQDFLLQRISNFVKVLYGLGCRNMLIAGLPPIGCGPAQMTQKYRFFRTCLENENVDSQTYNQKLQTLLPSIQATLPGSKLIYADIYTPMMDMISNPLNYGFVVTNRGCCGSGLVEAGPICGPTTRVCRNPSEYMFWDAVHPSEAAYRYMANYLVETSLTKF